MKKLFTILLILTLTLTLIMNASIAETEPQAARIGDKTYDDLQTAINDAKNEETVIITADIYLDEPLEIKKNITIRSEAGEKHTIASNYTDAAEPLVVITGNLCLSDLIFSSDDVSGIVVSGDDATAEFENTDFTKSADSGLTIIGAAVSVKNCTFAGNANQDISITAPGALNIEPNCRFESAVHISSENAPDTGWGTVNLNDPEKNMAQTVNGERCVWAISDKPISEPDPPVVHRPKPPAPSSGIIVPAETFKTGEAVIETNQYAQVKFDEKAAETIGKSAFYGTVTLTINCLKNTEETLELQMKIYTAGGFVDGLGGGSAEITVRPSALWVNPVCAYLGADGAVMTAAGEKRDDGTFSFTVTRCTDYVIEDDPAGYIEALVPCARCKAMRYGIFVGWQCPSDLEFDRFEIYRGRTKGALLTSENPYYRTKSPQTRALKNSFGLKKGARYYYRVRGVKEIDGVEYYTKFSNIVSRKVK